MTSSPFPEIDTLVRHLREDGVDIHDPGTGRLVVEPRGEGGPVAVVDIAERDLHDYVAGLAATYGRDLEDPWSSARGLAAVHVIEYLTTDHGRGVNRVRRLSLIRRGGGLRFVEERSDDPGPRPAVAGPHDDPVVYGRELEALARDLRAQDLLATAEPDAKRLLVERADGRGVVVDLRPDRYRRYLEGQEQAYSEVADDARELAWLGWYHQVLHALTGLPDFPHRLSFVESPEGEVFFVADANGDEPPEPRYVWSAEPGT